MFAGLRFPSCTQKTFRLRGYDESSGRQTAQPRTEPGGDRVNTNTASQLGFLFLTHPWPGRRRDILAAVQRGLAKDEETNKGQLSSGTCCQTGAQHRGTSLCYEVDGSSRPQGLAVTDAHYGPDTVERILAVNAIDSLPAGLKAFHLPNKWLMLFMSHIRIYALIFNFNSLCCIGNLRWLGKYRSS